MFDSEDLYYGKYGTEKALGVNMGDMRLAQAELPVWETQYDRTYYLMKGGGTGIIHEGRYQLKDFNEQVARVAGRIAGLRRGKCWSINTRICGAARGHSENSGARRSMGNATRRLRRRR